MSIEPRIRVKSFWGFLGALLLFVFLGYIQDAYAQKNIPVFAEQGAVSILPHLVAFPDPTGELTIADILLSSNEEDFVSLNDQSLKSSDSTFWLRFTLSALNISKNQDNYLLDLGQNIPGIAELYVAKIDVKNQTIGWEKFTSTNNSIFLFPKEDIGISMVYIKLQGPSGLWFNPVLRSTYNAATTYDHMPKYILFVTLSIMMFFCIIRGTSEKSEWWFWTSLYLGSVLLKSFLGIPATPFGVVQTDEMAAAVLPGISLIILAHIARHLMKSENTVSKSLGRQYLFLTIPGAVIAVLPLIPDFSWTARYLELWPLAILLLVPTTLGAWLSGIYGSRRFLLGCLIPPICTVLAIMGIGSGISSDLLATIPNWGVVLGTLAIMAIGSSPQQATSSASLQNTIARDATATAMQDPSLRIVSENEVDENTLINETDSYHVANVSRDESLSDGNLSLAWEDRLRVPLDTLSIEILAFKEYSLPAVAKEHINRINDLVNNLNETLQQPLNGVNDYKDLDVPLGNDNYSFDLQKIMRMAHDSVADMAEQKNIGLSWFMPPVLGNKYMGNGQSLLHCLRLLLNNAVRATNSGAVKMSVRRVPESTDTGHLLFSVTDTGLGMPPYRSSASLGRVWELVASHKGFFGIECSPDGVSISFTLRLQAITGEQPLEASDYGGYAEKNMEYEDAYGTEETRDIYATSEQRDNELVLDEFNNIQEVKSGSSIIIVDYSLSNRQLLTFFLEGLPFYTREAKTPDECVELHLKNQALLIIFDDSLPDDEIFNAINRIRAFEMENGLPSSLILALTKDKTQWVELHEGGFTHAVEKPITRALFRNTIQDLLYELVGLFPAQDEQCEQQEFDKNEQDSVSFSDEKENVINYDNTYVREEIVTTEGNISNAHSLDDFVSPESKQSVSSSYSDEQDFAPEIMPYKSEYDFLDEHDSTKIDNENDQHVKKDSEVEEFDNAQDNDFSTSEHVNILLGKTIQETLDENIHETLDQLNDDNVFDAKIDATLDTNVKDKSINGFDAVLHTEFSNNDEGELADNSANFKNNIDNAVLEQTQNVLNDDENSNIDEPFLMEKETSASREDEYLVEIAKEAQINEVDNLQNDVLKNEINYSTDELEYKQTKEGLGQGAITGAAVLHQNSELKELITEDEYKFFDEAIEQTLEQEIESTKYDVDINEDKENQENKEDQEYKEILFGEGDELNGKESDAAVDSSLSTAMTTSSLIPTKEPISESKTVEKPLPRPSLIPQSSFLMDYIIDDKPSSDKARDTAVSNIDNDRHKQNNLDINFENHASAARDGKVADKKGNIENNFNNDLLSMLHEVKEPKFENGQKQDDFSLTNWDLNMENKIVDRVATQNNLQINMNTVDVAARQSLSSEPISVKNDNYVQETANTSKHNSNDAILSENSNILNNLNNSADTAEQNSGDYLFGVEEKNSTNKDSGASFSRLLASGNSKTGSPIPVLLDELDESIKYAKSGYAQNDVLAVGEAAAYIAKRTEACGLRSLSRMALCVEEAAKAEDFDALIDLLPELETAIERNRISLQSHL